MANDYAGIDLGSSEPCDPALRLSMPPSEVGNAAIQEDVNETRAETDGQEEVITGTAPQRATRTRVVPFDDPAEVPNRTLAEWDSEYLNFMEAARVENLGRISVAQAKRNAAYWVLDQGLGDVASNFQEDFEQHPLAIFSGHDLIDSLLGPPREPQSRKRSASAIAGSNEDADGSQRSKKARTQLAGGSPSARRGRRELDATGEDGLGAVFGDEDIEIEVGRGTQAPLSDHLSDAPWNTYASSRAGSVRRGLSIVGASSSMQGRGTFDVNFPSSNVKRVSQLIRESPLDRRRRLMQLSEPSNQDNTDLMSLRGGFDVDDDDLDARLAGNLDDEFELDFPVGDGGTQDSAVNRWVSENLEKEAFNFLDFLHTSIRKKEKEGLVQIDEEQNPNMTFEELLPLDDTNEIVAAQGLLHVLSLATKGLIKVQQEKAFGSISMSVVSAVMAESERDAEDDIEEEGGEELDEL